MAYRGHLILVGYLPIFFIILICENIFFSQLKDDNFDTFLIHIVIVSGNEILWSLKITLKQFLENYNKTRYGEIVNKKKRRHLIGQNCAPVDEWDVAPLGEVEDRARVRSFLSSFKRKEENYFLISLST